MNPKWKLLIASHLFAYAVVGGVFLLIGLVSTHGPRVLRQIREHQAGMDAIRDANIAEREAKRAADFARSPYARCENAGGIVIRGNRVTGEIHNCVFAPAIRAEQEN